MTEFTMRLNPGEFICRCHLRCDYGDVAVIVPEGDGHSRVCLRCGVAELRKRSDKERREATGRPEF